MVFSKSDKYGFDKMGFVLVVTLYLSSQIKENDFKSDVLLKEFS